MAEYIFTNLPQYIRVTPRTDFANSVVQENHVLLFSEDGETLTGKLSDGTFITIGDGTDVSDTTATAATVLSGYDFYNASGVKTSGSIQTVTASASGNVVTVPAGYIASAQTLTIGTAIAAQTITPGTVDQTIAADSFLSGAITIKGDANLIAANIASGVTIFGVTGTHQGGGGGSTDFYKCASVDTVNSTWTGYKAVLSAGSYSFEFTVTSGLTYGSGFIPEVGKIYTDGALVRVDALFDGLPVIGLVFYAPLATDSVKAETGQNMASSNMSYSAVNGIPCGVFNGYGYLSGSDSLISGNQPFTISLWVKSNTTSAIHWGFTMGNMNSQLAGIGMGIRYDDEYAFIVAYSDDENTGIAASTTEWKHLLHYYDGNGTGYTYVNGVLARTFQCGNLNIGSGWSIGMLNFEYWDGYLAGIRVYNRELTAAEITALANEFTPTPGV